MSAEIRCSKCGRAGVRIAKFRIWTDGAVYICEDCAKA